MNQDPFDVVVSKLQGSRFSHNHAQARCPIHDDRKASLSVTRADDGTVLITCHAGCNREDVIKALGLNWPDLFSKPLEHEDESETTYDYCGPDGNLVYQVVRKPGKKFLQRQPDGRGGWIWNLQGIQPLPYRLPELLTSDSDTVFIVEGEKDVENLRALGLTATCNSGGAGKFRPELAQWFKGLDVVILADNDEPGREHADLVYNTLEMVAESVRVLTLPGLPEKGDVSDWLNQGHGREDLLELLEEKSDRFGLISVASRLSDLARDESVEIGDAIAQVERMLAKLKADQEPGTEQALDDVILAYLQAQEDLASGKRALGVATGYVDLDSILGNLGRSDLVILAARPAMGKTSLAVNIGINVAAILGKPTLMFSMEMGAEQIAARVLSSLAGIDLSSLRQGRLDADEAMRLATQAASLVGVPFYIEPSPYLTTEQLRTRAYSFLARHHRLGLVVVDYLQLMSSGGRGNKVQEVTEISRALKGLARELNVPVLALSQLSRSVESRERKVPQLSDLRESGAIEQDADAVIAVYRDDYYDEETDRPNLADLIVLKHRNGPTGKVTLHFDKATTTFRNLEAYSQQ